MTPAVAQSLDIIMTLGGSPYPRHPHGPGWQQEPWISSRPWLQQGHHPRHGPSGSLAHMVSWLQLAVHVPQIWVAPEAARPLDTNMVTGGGPDSGHPCGLWWQQEPWSAMQTKNAEGPQTLTSSSTATCAQKRLDFLREMFFFLSFFLHFSLL